MTPIIGSHSSGNLLNTVRWRKPWWIAVLAYCTPALASEAGVAMLGADEIAGCRLQNLFENADV